MFDKSCEQISVGFRSFVMVDDGESLMLPLIYWESKMVFQPPSINALSDAHRALFMVDFYFLILENHIFYSLIL